MAPPPEIAIPSTSITDESSGKPYTLYNITLRLPLRSFVVQKRYSDFSKLHETLVEVVGVPPPQPMPAKNWLKSTVKSPDLTRDRQVSLERYLKAIAESPDRRWRDTTAWKLFLNLPSSSTNNSAVSATGRAANMASGSADPSTWLDIHREMKQLLHEARLAITKRDAAADAGSTTAAEQAALTARRATAKAGTFVATLAEGLKNIQESKRLGEGELRRRRDLLSAARMEKDGLDKLANSKVGSGARVSAAGPATVVSSNNLLRGGKAPSGRVLGGAPVQETAKTKELDNAGLLLLQKKEMEQQDEHLDQLTTIIQRTKQMGMQIDEELTMQNEMLDEVQKDTDRLDAKLGVGKNRLRKLGGK